MIQTIFSFLSGKKTYIIGGLMVILGILQKNDQVILNGFAIISGRAAIAKLQ